MLAKFLLGASKRNQIQYVGGVTGSAATASTINVSLTSLTGGISSSVGGEDYVVVCWGFNLGGSADFNFTPPTGYTEIVDLFSNDTRRANMSVAVRRMPAVPSNSITLPSSGNAIYPTCYAVQVWRGVASATSLDVSTTTATGINTGRPDAPSITPVTAGAVILACGLGTGGNPTPALTAPSGMGNFLTSSAPSGYANGSVVGMASVAWAGGAYNPAAFGGGSTSTSDSWCAATLALKPL